MKIRTRVSQKALILNNEGKLLALFRTETAPSHPNTWDFPGGELEAGEDPRESILREIKEEVGLQVEDIIPFDVEGHIVDKKEFWVTVAYKVRAKNDTVKLSFEHNDFQWLTPEGFLKFKAQEKLHRFARNLKGAGDKP